MDEIARRGFKIVKVEMACVEGGGKHTMDLILERRGTEPDLEPNTPQLGPVENTKLHLR